MTMKWNSHRIDFPKKTAPSINVLWQSNKQIPNNLDNETLTPLSQFPPGWIQHPFIQIYLSLSRFQCTFRINIIVHDFKCLTSVLWLMGTSIPYILKSIWIKSLPSMWIYDFQFPFNALYHTYDFTVWFKPLDSTTHYNMNEDLPSS